MLIRIVTGTAKISERSLQEEIKDTRRFQPNAMSVLSLFRRKARQLVSGIPSPYNQNGALMHVSGQPFDNAAHVLSNTDKRFSSTSPDMGDHPGSVR